MTRDEAVEAINAVVHPEGFFCLAGNERAQVAAILEQVIETAERRGFEARHRATFDPKHGWEFDGAADVAIPYAAYRLQQDGREGA